MNDLIVGRLALLRKRMQEEGIDAYMVPTEDFHSSEYVGEYFKCRKFLTGFTGSAGTAVVTMDEARLWTDGRYFLQASVQLEGTTIQLMKMGEKDVPAIEEYLKKTLKDGQTLGYDGRTVSASQARALADILGRGIALRGDVDLVGDIWDDRPPMSAQPVWELEIRWCGQSRQDKLAMVREKMAEQKADVLLLSSLDDIAWLLNLRGDDVACNPVFLSYLAVEKERAVLFANTACFDDELVRKLAADGVDLQTYSLVYAYAAALSPESRVWLHEESINSRLADSLPAAAQRVLLPSPTKGAKAVKNPVEIENMRMAHIRDGAAVCRFIYWLKKNAARETITELSAAEKLYALRQEQKHFAGNSFDPIIAYREHGAVIHYSASPETDVRIKPEGMVLADTGGQYLEGTTDITRTFAVGPVTQEEKEYFTAVLRGHIRLAMARFKQGCSGVSLDILARQPLWDMGADYNHGTGHGVGYFLNVHEGPQRIIYKTGKEKPAGMMAGMITSDEPGYYEDGKFGVRHENLLLCKEDRNTPWGTFLCFEPLTLVPFDLECILPEKMTPEEIRWLNEYHQTVYGKIGPLLPEEERAWLKTQTRGLTP